MEESGASPGESRQGDGSTDSRPWPDNVIMSVAFVGLGGIVLRGLYCFPPGPNLVELAIFVFPFLCQWLHGVFVAKTMNGRCWMLFYGVFSVYVSCSALYDIYKSRCASMVVVVFSLVTIPSIAVLLFGLVCMAFGRWKTRSVVVKE